MGSPTELPPRVTQVGAEKLVKEPNRAALLASRGATAHDIVAIFPPTGLPQVDRNAPPEVRARQQTEQFASMIVRGGLIPEDTQHALQLKKHASDLEMGDLTFAEQIVLEAFVRSREELQLGSPVSWGHYTRIANDLQLAEEYPEAIGDHEAKLKQGPYRDVEKRLSTMNRSIREVYDLHYVNGLSLAEIGNNLVVSEEYTVNKLNAAKSYLLSGNVTPEEKGGAPLIESLVPAAVGGDRRARERLLEELHPLVMRYCRGRLGRQERGIVSADDVAQEVFLAVVAALPKYKIKGLSFRAFVYGIAAHKITDTFRANGRNKSEPVAELPEIAVTHDGPEQRVLMDELGRKLGEMLQRLTPKQREILILRIVAGLSAKKVAALVNSTPGAVRVAQHRSLNRLRAVMPGSGTAGEDKEPKKEPEALKVRTRASEPEVPVQPATQFKLKAWVTISEYDRYLLNAQAQEMGPTAIARMTGKSYVEVTTDIRRARANYQLASRKPDEPFVTRDLETPIAYADDLVGVLVPPNERSMEREPYDRSVRDFMLALHLLGPNERSVLFERHIDMKSVYKIGAGRGGRNKAVALLKAGTRDFGDITGTGIHLTGPRDGLTQPLQTVEELQAFEAKLKDLLDPEEASLILLAIRDRPFMHLTPKMAKGEHKLKLAQARQKAFRLLRSLDGEELRAETEESQETVVYLQKTSPDTLNPETEALRSDVMTGLLFLSPRQQQALVEHSLHKKTLKEIADDLRSNRRETLQLVIDAKHELGAIIGSQIPSVDLLALITHLPDAEERDAFVTRLYDLEALEPDKRDLIVGASHVEDLDKIARNRQTRVEALKPLLRNARRKAFNALRNRQHAEQAKSV